MDKSIEKHGEVLGKELRTLHISIDSSIRDDAKILLWISRTTEHLYLSSKWSHSTKSKKKDLLQF